MYICYFFICGFLSVVVHFRISWGDFHCLILYSTASISLPAVTGCAIFVVNLYKGKEAEQLLNIGLIWDYVSQLCWETLVSSCSKSFV